jgi:hypothetical protein
MHLYIEDVHVGRLPLLQIFVYQPAILATIIQNR